ncbi:MAG: SusC/RagA family TonB-linked outer membrane protein [Chitinophagaceae bacterium]
MKKFLCFIASVLLAYFAQAQMVEVSGKVLDSKGLPVPNASIQERSSRKGTVTDINGFFRLSTTRGTVLRVSSVGFDSKDINVGSSNDLTVTLSSSDQSLSEVVVTGVGVATSKRKLGISVEAISASKLPPVPSASIDQALVGKVPGAQIQSIDGTPGARTDIKLRGINSIQGGTKPLILLDGIEVYSTDINSLDLSNVERIEVVQGAASATLYGAQGANGVIQLFSKKGKKGQPVINLSTSYGIDQYINEGNVHKATKHSFLTNATGEVVDPAGNIAKLDENGIYQEPRFAFSAGAFPSAQLNPNNIYNKLYNKNLKYYDHFDQMFGNGFTRNNSANISGGGDRVDYSFGLSNAHQSSAIRHNGYVDRTNFTTNIGADLFKGFKIRSITELVYTKNTLNPYFTAGRNSIFEMLNTSPFYDLNKRLPDSTLPFYLGNDISTHSVNGYNPNYYFDYVQGRDYTTDILQNLQASYEVNRFINLDVKYGINHTRNDVNWLYKDQSGNVNVQYEQDWASNYNGDDPNGEINNFNSKTTFQNFLATVFLHTDFQRDFHSKLPITTSTQLSYDYRKRQFSNYVTYGKHLQPYAVYNLSQTATQGVATDIVIPFVTYGFLANQKVDIGDFGGFSVGVRSDYSSAFGGGSKPATFPRGDAYIRLSSFNFWENTLNRVITEFKIRAAYGAAGIQPGAFDRYLTISPQNIGSGLAFRLPSTINNPDLKVEVSKEFEIGTDISFHGLKGSWFPSIAFSGTYWTRKGENIIYNVSAAPSTGAITNKNNALFLSSKGVQASLNLTVYHSRNFNYDFTTNFGKQSSKIDKIIGGDIILTTSAGSTSIVLTEGQRIGQIFGFKAFTGLDQTRKDGSLYINKADQGKYQMVNGHVVDTASKVIQFTNETYPLGTGTPKFNMAFINSLTFKDFVTLGFQFDWIYGTKLYNQTKEWMYRDGIHGDYDEEVTINGVTAAFSPYHRSAYSAIFGQPNGSGRNGTKDYFLEDASFVRLRNLSLGVDLAKIANIKFTKRLQLVFSGRNLLTFTKYTGFDPEISSGGSTYSSFDRGIDHNSMPNVKSYQVGLNVGF